MLLLLLSAAVAAEAAKPEKIFLYADKVPGAVGTEARDKPCVMLYRPDAKGRTDAAVLVVPGGGYGGLAMGHEGKEIAEWLNARGVTAYVLEYRLGPRYRHPVPLNDAQRAMRLIRSRAKADGVDPAKVGVWGFSAGGHLASTLSTKFDKGKGDADDPIEKMGCRPDFAILCYPVIRMDPPHAHMGSRNNLLGPKPDAALVASLCNDTQVTKETPPTFLFHTKPDKAVVLANSELYYAALVKAGVPAKLHVVGEGAHGVGLAKKIPAIADWPKTLEAWLVGRKVLPEPSK